MQKKNNVCRAGSRIFSRAGGGGRFSKKFTNPPVNVSLNREELNSLNLSFDNKSMV